MTRALHHVGITSLFTWVVAPSSSTSWRRFARRPRRAPVVRAGQSGRPSRQNAQRVPGATSRWNRGKDLSWEPLAPNGSRGRLDHLQGDRFRHGTTFKRWRLDKPASECRYDQLETSTPSLLRLTSGREGQRAPDPRRLVNGFEPVAEQVAM